MRQKITNDQMNWGDIFYSGGDNPGDQELIKKKMQDRLNNIVNFVDTIVQRIRNIELARDNDVDSKGQMQDPDELFGFFCGE